LGDGKIQFTIEAKNASSFEWNFGDNTTSTEQNPIHQYTKNGKYTVVLIARNNKTQVTKTYEVTVTDAPKPIVKFSYKSLGNGTLQFTNESQNAESYKWDFGDGQTSVEVSPQHSFSVNGTYEVKLTAESVNGKTETKQNVVIADAPKPEAFFTFTYGENGLVSFTNASKNYTQLSWKFDNGDSSTVENPTVKYKYNGRYNVLLKAKNANGENLIYRVINITNVSTPPGGYILFWTNNPGSNIKIWINDEYVGTVTKFSKTIPDCNTEGFVTLNLKEGSYFFMAQEESVPTTNTGATWTGVINTVNGQCRKFELTR
jgi:PKD repeat protein